MKFNILYLHETARFSGAEESLFNLSRFLNKEKFEPCFILPEEGLFKKKLEGSGSKVFIVTLPRIRCLKGVFASAKKILAISRENWISLMHTNSIRTHIYGAYVAKKLKIPLVWHERNLIFSDLIDLDRIFSSLADAIICNSFAVAKRFMKKGALPAKVKVVYNGVDTGRFHAGIDGNSVRVEFGISKEKIVVGIAGHLGKRKGIEGFLQAAKIISERFDSAEDKFRFLIAGADVFGKGIGRIEHLKRMAKKYGIDKKVIFTGFRSDMPQVYAAMDILVSVSLLEACGRSILEAMATGKPVVAADSGGNPELVKDGISGLLFSPRDPGTLTEAIMKLARDRRMAEQMGSSGRRIVEEKFTIQKNAEKIEAVYQELLNKHAA
ncbi:MAG: glycosyltransferase family 4 protein [Candidatus Omnitrophica bacterium]|nr:glycosyltransferase family 4 protein [Candidatus Omnitrophota bacterium]MDD5610518.1 glycosyltransferase family 4 protein [Candidatus Omnitrophota bacterium]